MPRPRNQFLTPAVTKAVPSSMCTMVASAAFTGRVQSI